MDKDELESRLSLQKLQLKSLLTLTQGINENWSSADIYRQYQEMLTFTLGLSCYVLFILQDGEWTAVSYTPQTLNEARLRELDPQAILARYTRPARIDEADLAEFDLLIPVFHKQQPLALLLFNEETSADSFRFSDEPISFVRTLTNIVAVAIENKRLFKRQVAEERLRRDLELAKQVQKMLLPARLPQNDNFAFAGFYQPHQGIGGDYYDVIELSEHEIAFCIADISGKGIAAALIMSNFQANLRSLIHRRHLKIGQFIEALNEAVAETTQRDKFISFFVAHYNLRTRRLLYVNAGHNIPLLCQNGQIIPLDKGCTILGMLKPLPSVEYGSLYLQDEAFVFLYTDGLSETANAAGDFFMDKIEDFVRENSHLPVAEFNQHLLAELDSFRGGSEFNDDISILSAKLFNKKLESV